MSRRDRREARLLQDGRRDRREARLLQDGRRERREARLPQGGRRPRGWLAALGLSLSLLGPGCQPAESVPEAPIAVARREAAASRDGELVARWLLLELHAVGGRAERARAARQHLDEIAGTGMLADYARGVDDALHGELERAPEHFLRAIEAARGSDHALAPLVGWSAAREARLRRYLAPGLWKRWGGKVAAWLDAPGRLGWRARAELGSWWAAEAWSAAERDVEAGVTRRFGCATELALAGPFGRGVPRDLVRSFPAEAPGPWPATFPLEPGRGRAPRVLPTRRTGCTVRALGAPGAGAYYVQTFLELDHDQELLLAVDGARALWVDDHLVLARDPREFGVWPRFGAQLRLRAGRHRVLARVAEPSSTVQILRPDGAPAGVRASAQGGAPYLLSPPEVTHDPNLLDAWIRPDGVRDPGDDVTRVLLARLALAEGVADVASLLLEPLVKDPGTATGPTLALAAEAAQGDPIFDPTQVRDLARELAARAVKSDPALWGPALALALHQVEKTGPASGVSGVRALRQRFPRVLQLETTLASLYGELGWVAEHAATVRGMVERFPESPEALAAGIDVLDAAGDAAGAEALVKRLLAVDPDSEIELTRALARSDWDAALRELERLRQRRPDRRAIGERVEDILVAAARGEPTLERLEKALEEAPRSATARLALADARFARGELPALRRALVQAFEQGAPTGELEAAIDLVEGTTALDAYRLDARQVMREYDAAGRHMPGTSARVLDYSAVWVAADGSSRSLTHELVRLQSDEAVSELAERPLPRGLVLALRVHKADGRTLEPEIVAGKPTVTFPHLEVGDTLETEYLSAQGGDGEGGLAWAGPRWYFREPDVAYARSELVVITPSDKALQIETEGAVPPPAVTEEGAITVRRWRMDFIPAAPVEPLSVPPREFLPNVALGWGVGLERRVQALADSMVDLTPVDPRLRRIAERIVHPLPKTARRERARRLYRWLVDNVEDGEQSDGRKAILGKSGNRWRAYLTLCRSLGLPAHFAVAQSTLTLPPQGELSRAGKLTLPVVVVELEQGPPIWLTLRDRHAPFGFVPAEARGSEAMVLADGEPRPARIPAEGVPDGVEYGGTVKLAADGSAALALALTLQGEVGMAMRNGFGQIPVDQVGDVLEARVLGRALRGARLVDHALLHLDDPDQALVVKMNATQAAFAQRDGASLVLSPPFAPTLRGLATLPVRQTPMLLAETQYQRVLIRIELPAGADAPTLPAPRQHRRGTRTVTVNDRVEGRTLILDRTIDITAGRIPVAEYADFQRFVTEADQSLHAVIRIPVGG